MEEIKNEIEEEEYQRWITILLIIGNIIIWTIIMLFISIAKVEAQEYNYNNDINYIGYEVPPSTTIQWESCNFGQTCTLSILRFGKLLVGQWSNLQAGTINGVYNITNFSVPSGTTCSELKQAYTTINDTRTNSTITYPTCNINGTTANLQVKFQTTIDTSGIFKVVVPVPTYPGGTYTMSGNLFLVTKDYATNTDIENQTISIINNAIQNAQDIITNSINENILNRNAITGAVEDAAESIINNAIDLSKICQKYNYENEPKEIENKFILYTNGSEVENSNWYISSYLPLVTGNYTISYNANPGAAGYCIYNEDKTINRCFQLPNATSVTFNGKKGQYIRYSIIRSTTNKVTFTGNNCQDRTDALLEEFDLIYSFTFNHVTPDETQFNITHQMENEILDMADDIDLTVVEVDLDTESSNWVWTTMTTLLNTNQLVFGMVLSILSIGIIKLVLGR